MNDLLNLKRVIDIKIPLFQSKSLKHPEYFLLKYEYLICPTCWIVKLVYLCLRALWNAPFFIFYRLYCYKIFVLCFWLSSNKIRSLHSKKITNFSSKYEDINSIDIISIIYGSLLGKSRAEKRKDGTCIIFDYKVMHLSYPLTIYKDLVIRGYCDKNSLQIGKDLGKKGKLYKTINFKTRTYDNFDWIYDIWYTNGIKKIPNNISEYFTNLVLAIWVMDSGVKTLEGLSFSNNFTLFECELLAKILYDKFKIKALMKNKGVPGQFQLYIVNDSMPKLKNQISDYIIPSMKYKIN